MRTASPGIRISASRLLGKLDPKTGKHTEYPVPEHKKGLPTGLLGLRADRDGNMWLGIMYQATIAKFDRKTEKFQFWTLPPEHEQRRRASQHGEPAILACRRQGLVAEQRLRRRPPARPRDRQHRVLGAVQELGDRRERTTSTTSFRTRRTTSTSPTSANSTSGASTPRPDEIKLYAGPDAAAPAPRRGMMDAQDRLWFGEYRGDKIGMFDTKTEKFTGMADADALDHRPTTLPSTRTTRPGPAR